MLLLALGLQGGPELAAQAHWTRFTNRSENPSIAEYLQLVDFSEALQTVRALGEREEPFVGDILASLPAAVRRAGERDVLIRELVAVLVSRGWQPVNREALNRLAEGLPAFGPALQAQLIRVLKDDGSSPLDRVVLAQAERLAELLRRQAGRTDAEHSSLLLAVLEYAEARADPLFLDPVLRLLEGSREREVGHRAQQVASRLARIRTASGNPGEW